MRIAQQPSAKVNDPRSSHHSFAYSLWTEQDTVVLLARQHDGAAKRHRLGQLFVEAVNCPLLVSVAPH